MKKSDTLNEATGFTVSPDGYVRMTYDLLQKEVFQHFDSGLYLEQQNSTITNDKASEMCGYTEWITEGTPQLSMGWDWKFQHSATVPSFVMVGLPYTNILIQKDNFEDLSQQASLGLLSQHIESLNWSAPLLRHITKRYK